MAQTCEQIISRIKQLIGRSVNLNTTLDIDNILLDALNEAQRYIVRKLPHITNLQVRDTATLKTVTDQYSYSIASIVSLIAHIRGICIMNGSSSKYVRCLHPEDFDKQWPDVSSVGSGLPKYYTLRSDSIEFNCPISSTYSDKIIRIDYCRWPTEFSSITSTQMSDLNNADYGLILFAWADVLRVLAKGNGELMAISTLKMQMFQEWLNTYKSYYDSLYEELVE